MIVLGLLLPAALLLTLLACLAGGGMGRADARLRAGGAALARRIGRGPAFLGIALLGFGVVMGVLIPLGLATRRMTASFDEPIFHWIRPRADALPVDLTKTMATFTAIGNRSTMELVATVAVLVLGTAYGRRWFVPVLAILVAVALQRQGQIMLTHIVPRTHPDVPDAGVFPSGGVSRLISVYGMIVALALDLLPAGAQQRWRPRAWTGIALFGVLEAYTREYLSLHWTTDVVTGLLFGFLLLAIEVAALEALNTARGRPTSPTSPTPGVPVATIDEARVKLVTDKQGVPTAIAIPDELLTKNAAPPELVGATAGPLDPAPRSEAEPVETLEPADPPSDDQTR